MLDILEAAKLAIHYPEIPWSDLISMRNVMIHEYDDIDFGIVWETVKNDLPLLVDSLNNILGSH